MSKKASNTPLSASKEKILRWECRECISPCILDAHERELFRPQSCPYFGNYVYWKAVVK